MISGERYRFSGPSAIASNGRDVFVANQLNNSVTEIDARTGAPSR